MGTTTRIRRRRPALVAPWPTGESVVVVLLLLGLSIPVYLLFALTDTSTERFDGYVTTTGAQALQDLLLTAASLAAVWLVARRKDAPLLHTVGLRRPSRGWLIMTGLLSLLLLIDRVLVPWLFGGPGIASATLPPQFAADGFTGIWLAVNLVLIGLLTPFEEEILYRGVLFGWLQSWAGKLPALLLSAGVFAVTHAELGNMNVLLAFLMGLLATWMYERSGSIIPAITLHAGWNTATTLTIALIYAA